MTNRFFLYYFSLLISISAFSQLNTSTLNLEGDVTAWFDDAIGETNLRIVTGTYYQVKNGSKLSHQFFLNDKWTTADITYYGNTYNGLNAMYDILDDKLLIRHPNNYNYFAQPILIHQEHVEAFTMFDHTFKYYSASLNPPLGSGYYDELMMGNNIRLMAKRKKYPTVDSGELYVGFEKDDQYFIYYEGAYHKIVNRRSIIKTLKPYKKQLRQYIRQHVLIIRYNGGFVDHSIVELLDYCDGIISGE